MKIIKGIIFALGILSLLIVILISTTFIIAKHVRVKDLVEKEIEQCLGINVTISDIKFSPFFARISMKGIIIHNPQGFAEDELAYLEYLHFSFDPIEVFIKPNPYIYLTAVDLKRLNIIKNKNGKINLKELGAVMGEAGKNAPKPPFQFAVVVLSVGEVKYIDESGPSRKETKYVIDMKEVTFVGLKDENAVVKMIIYKAIEHTDIGKLINLTIVPVFSSISNTMGSAWGTAKVGAKSVWEIATLPVKLLFGKN